MGIVRRGVSKLNSVVLSCGHAYGPTICTVGHRIYCDRCEGESVIVLVTSTGVTFVSIPTVDDAIVDMVFDALETEDNLKMGGTRAINKSRVKARFANVLRNIRPSPTPLSKPSTDRATLGDRNFTEAEAYAEMSKLVTYFRTPEGNFSFGSDGDSDGLSPAETAIRAMKQLRQLRGYYNSSQAECVKLTEALEATRNERNQAQARVGSFVLTVKDRDEEIQRHKDTLSGLKTFLGDLARGFWGPIPGACQTQVELLLRGLLK